MRAEWLSVALLATRALASEPAGPACWSVDQGASSIRFTAVQAGARFEGGFNRFEASICFAPDDLAGSRARIVIDVASVTTGNAERDQTLVSADWFEPARFARAVFESRRFERTASGFRAMADLTIRDATVPVTLTFGVVDNAGIMTLTGAARLERLAFGLGRGEWQDTSWVGNEVDIDVRVVAHVAAGTAVP